MIEIDSSIGEGGGQVLRTGLSLACLLGKSVEFTNIRAKRPKPGLQAQHLTCVRALRDICSAEVKGAELGSGELQFLPGEVKSGKFFFDIGTAGSITLLAQCILPVLLFGKQKSEVEFIGGTHVPFSPPADYFSDVFLPVVAKMGVKARFETTRIGFYPKGGGKARLSAEPSELKPLVLEQREQKPRVDIRSVYACLPSHVGQRQGEAAASLLASFAPVVVVNEEKANCPGSFVFVKAGYGNCVAGFFSLGRIGKQAEQVGREASNSFLEFEKSGACVDVHLADQLLLYAALAKGESSFSVERISSHFETNAWVVSKFVDKKIEVAQGVVSVK